MVNSYTKTLTKHEGNAYEDRNETGLHACQDGHYKQQQQQQKTKDKKTKTLCQLILDKGDKNIKWEKDKCIRLLFR